jgi:hypothetical protein
MNTVLLVILAIALRQIDAAQPQARYTWMGDGHSLWSWCDTHTRQNPKMSSGDRFRAHFCVGYLNGVIDMEKRAGAGLDGFETEVKAGEAGMAYAINP